MKYERVGFCGRSLAEYQRMFGFDIDELVGCQVLDCAAGPASFAAEAQQHDVDVIAIDPQYGKPVETLRQLSNDDWQTTFRIDSTNPTRVVRKGLGTSDEIRERRRRTLETFLEDYRRHCGARYLAGALPTLPLDDDRFDFAFCGHLLFNYSELLSCDFHVEAISELIRVTRKEVRLFPVCSFDTVRSPHLERCLQRLRKHGVFFEFCQTDYEVVRNWTQCLVIRKGSRR